ncbi:hypothetical protein [Streptococcus ictaluri]|uniref:Uncharacterized protein n=1 Tax=Streptococcus ictaluri 707-05 TaxID=764299 RepID=G5K1V3_9STRE|nr:hypothetical protein [Streptococcus ictaluri]EHI69990.1 hypothetical protein STRIC_2361 [Streptococcus ictaluri 707-05]
MTIFGYQLFRFTEHMTLPYFALLISGMLAFLIFGFVLVYCLASKTFRLK